MGVALTHKMVERYIKEFERLRDDWVAILVDNPCRTDAPTYISSCNAKLEFLQLFRDPERESDS